jgi:D-hexose-6-phosphate mutarotase
MPTPGQTTLADMTQDDSRRMLCIETASCRKMPIHIAAGQTHRIGCTVSVESM